jgi:two-component system response regulator YesN
LIGVSAIRTTKEISDKQRYAPLILRVVSAFETIFSQDALVISFSASPSESLLLVIFNSTKAAHSNEDLKSRIQVSLSGFDTGGIIHTIFSPPLNTWNDVKVSYKNIHHCLRSLHDTKDSYILCSTEYSDTSELNLTTLEIMEEKLLSAIQYGTAAETYNILIEMRKLLVDAAGISFASRQAYIIHVTSSVLQMLDDEITARSIDSLKVFSRLLSCSNIQTLYEFFFTIIQEYAAQFQMIHKKKSHEAVISVTRLIDTHYKENLTLADLADAVHLNASYLSVLFKNSTGTTVTDYLTGVRLDRAKELLRDTSLKVYEIAEKVGFKTIAYFTSVFKKSEGVTPGEFRKKMESL